MSAPGRTDTNGNHLGSTDSDLTSLQNQPRSEHLIWDRKAAASTKFFPLSPPLPACADLPINCIDESTQ